MKRIKLVPPLNEAVALVCWLAALLLCVALSMAVTMAVLAPAKYAEPYIEARSLEWHLFFIILLCFAALGIFAYTLVRLYKVVCVDSLWKIFEKFFEVVESPLQESKAWNIGVIVGSWCFIALVLVSLSRCGPSCPPAGGKPVLQQEAGSGSSASPEKLTVAAEASRCPRR